jgi:hypothetical protein
MESIVDKMKPLQDLTIMKDFVIAFFSELSFDKEKHIYNTGEIQLKSVSNVIKKYHKNINFKQVAFFVAKSRGITVEEVLTEWEETKNNACKQGTLVHTFSELYTSNFDKVIANNGYEQAVINFWDLLPTNLVPFLFELQMYSKSLGIGGTADIILYNTNTGKFVIADYKTNKDIYKNYNKTKLLTPFNNLLDNPLNKYKIQLSLYQILFEQCGFQVENRFLIWLKEDGSFEQIDLEDLTNELKTDLKNE